MSTRHSRSSSKSKWSVRNWFGLDAPALFVLLAFLVIVIRPIIFRSPEVKDPQQAATTTETRKNDDGTKKEPAHVMGAVVWCCTHPGQVCEQVDEADCDGGFSNNPDQCSAVCRRAGHR